MRRFLYILGAVTLIVIVAAGIGLGVVMFKGSALDAESKAFVDSAVPAITATWNAQQLLDRATPELRASVKPQQLKALFEQFSQFGPLVQYEGATGESLMSYMAGSGSTVSASYLAKARFQNGNATIKILLMKRDGHWMIHGFHVDPAPGNQAIQRT